MKIETYKEVYYQPIRQISVPQALQNQPFEVFFVPIVRDDLPKSKNSPNPLLKGLGVMHDDLIAPTTNADDWELDWWYCWIRIFGFAGSTMICQNL